MLRRVSDLRRMHEKSSMWYDPERWEDADMQRNAWLRWAAGALLLAVVITVLAIGVGMLISAASSEELPCVYRKTFRQVEASALTDDPMSRYQTHQLFGFDGTRVDEGVGQETRTYRGCGDDSRVWIQYEGQADGVYRIVSTAFTWRYFGDGLITLQPARQAR